MDTDTETEEDITFDTFITTLETLYEEVHSIITSLTQISTQLETPTVYTILMEKVLPKALEENVRGVDVYQFILDKI